MGSIKALTLSVAIFGSLVSGAFAADMPAPPPLMPAPVLAPAAAALDTSGWYLRGDLGIGMTSTPKYSVDLLDYSAASVPVGGTPAGIFGPGMGDQMHIGFGAGYAINSWFRTDATLEYRGKANISAISNRYYIACSGGPPCVPGATHQVSDQYQGHTSSVVGLWNAYADLGTWSGITPYVGVGVGVARNSLSNVNYNGVDATYGGGASNLSHNTFLNKSTTSFAWAFMTGLSYDVTANTKLELGYRYLNMGKAATGVGTCVTTSPCFSSPEGPFKVAKMSSQDFHIGMRWMLGAPAYAANPEPLVRKF